MVQTGNVGFSEDRDLHRKGDGRTFPEDASGLTAPQIFEFPASPLFAAAREGKTVIYRRSAMPSRNAPGATITCSWKARAGSAFRSRKMNWKRISPQKERWPLAYFVSLPRLGSLNHTLLSLEAAHANGLKIAGVVYNYSKA